MNREALERAKSSLQIFDVYLGGSEIRLSEDYDPKYRPEAVHAQFRYHPHDKVGLTEMDHADQGKLRICRFRFETGVRLVKGIPEKDSAAAVEEENIKAQILATFMAEYRIVSADQPDSEALGVFAQNNVMYHVWPYWREYVQSACSRLRLPSFVMPMYHLPQENSHSPG